MESLISYSRYDYLIIFRVDSSGSIHIDGSSNRRELLEVLTGLRHDYLWDRELGLFGKDMFPKYFELHSKDREQLSETEMLTVASILKYSSNLKATLKATLGALLETSQIVFVMPPFADWNTHMVRTFFLESGWITNGDDDSKLLQVPFIEAHVNYLETYHSSKEHFEREGKYLLLHMQAAHKGAKFHYKTICFQMQCAKELLAASKKLAFSDFMLFPSVLNNKSTCLPSIDDKVLATAIKEIIAKFRYDCKIQHEAKSRSVGVPPIGKRLFAAIKGAAAKTKTKYKNRYEIESQDAEIAAKLAEKINGIQYSKEKTVGACLPSVDFKKYQLLGFESYPIDHLLIDLFRHTNVQQCITAVIKFIKESLSEYHSTTSNTPNDIRSVILSYDGPPSKMRLPCLFIERALLQAKIIMPRVRFVDSCRTDIKGAMERPLKIHRMINTTLPPLIMNEEEPNEIAALSNLQQEDSILLPLNSFYLQANINQRQINFILNKVVKASTTETSAKMFTAEERTVDIGDIQMETSDNLWKHLIIYGHNISY
ncbi:hypothetical protein MBANPS3_000590 [Mucor bainieri]